MIFIKDFKDGDTITGVYLCKSRTAAVTKAGKDFENVILSDKTGSVDSKIWDPNSPSIWDFDANDFVYVKGQVIVYNKAYQFKIDTIRKAEPGEYVESDYMAVSRFDPDEMMDELLGIIAGIRHPGIRNLLNAFFVEDSEFAARFKTASAAKSVHHGFVSGLLEHTLSVAKLCIKICQNYDFINYDILVASAILHDIGKTKEISAFPENDYTDEGNMIGHLVIGYGMVKEKLPTIDGMTDIVAYEIEHCILSHHGQLEYGSPKKPATVEAYALAAADNLDAHLETLRELFETKNANAWLGFNKWMDTNIRRTEI